MQLLTEDAEACITPMVQYVIKRLCCKSALRYEQRWQGHSLLLVYSSILLMWLVLMAYFIQTQEYWDSYLDAFYFSFVTATTIGFGDFAPDRSKESATTYIFILVGLFCYSLYARVLFDVLQTSRHRICLLHFGTPHFPSTGIMRTKKSSTAWTSHPGRKIEEPQQRKEKKTGNPGVSIHLPLPQHKDSGRKCGEGKEVTVAVGIFMLWGKLLLFLFLGGVILSALELTDDRNQAQRFWRTHEQLMCEFMNETESESCKAEYERSFQKSWDQCLPNVVVGEFALEQLSINITSRNAALRKEIGHAFDLLNSMGTCGLPPRYISYCTFTILLRLVSSFVLLVRVM